MSDTRTVMLMPKCGNCGAHVTKDYVRVKLWPGVDPDDLPACLKCPDKVIRGGEVRDARSNARRG